MIDKIDGLGGIRTPQPIRRTKKSGETTGASFSKHMGEADETAAASGVSATSAVTGILGIQEVDDALAQASRGKLRADEILDRLEDLRLGLLDGAIPKDKLIELSRILASRKAQIKDPRLVEILDAVDLRAQVELAKYSPI